MSPMLLSLVISECWPPEQVMSRSQEVKLTLGAVFWVSMAMGTQAPASRPIGTLMQVGVPASLVPTAPA